MMEKNATENTNGIFGCIPHARGAYKIMKHRHLLETDTLTMAAIDDIIDRGGRVDWAFLRESAKKSADVMTRIRKVCNAHKDDPFD